MGYLTWLLILTDHDLLALLRHSSVTSPWWGGTFMLMPLFHVQITSVSTWWMIRLRKFVELFVRLGRHFWSPILPGKVLEISSLIILSLLKSCRNLHQMNRRGWCVTLWEVFRQLRRRNFGIQKHLSRVRCVAWMTTDLIGVLSALSCLTSEPTIWKRLTSCKMNILTGYTYPTYPIVQACPDSLLQCMFVNSRLDKFLMLMSKSPSTLMAAPVTQLILMPAWPVGQSCLMCRVFLFKTFKISLSIWVSQCFVPS